MSISSKLSLENTSSMSIGKKISIQNEAVIGSALGRKVKFRNLEHAFHTVEQLRHHSMLQQKMRGKYQLAKISEALDEQVYANLNNSDWQAEAQS